MNSPEIQIWLYSRPDRLLTIEERHARFIEKMLKIEAPLGWLGLEPPIAPDRGKELVATFSMKYPIRGLKCSGDYTYRGEWYLWKDEASYDEHLRFKFSLSNKYIDYSGLLANHLSLINEAFGAYRAVVIYDMYSFVYEGGLDDKNPAYNTLRANPVRDVNGRNNIYTLHPAQFWDGELCQRALGFDRDEVIKRLKNVAIVARPLMDGVYLVLNDDPHLPYDAYVAMNERIKPMLGLHYDPPSALE